MKVVFSFSQCIEDKKKDKSTETYVLGKRYNIIERCYKDNDEVKEKLNVCSDAKIVHIEYNVEMDKTESKIFNTSIAKFPNHIISIVKLL